MPEWNASSILVEDNNDAPNLNICSMPDPEEVCSTTLCGVKTSVAPSDLGALTSRIRQFILIWHDDFSIITPDQYDNKLKDSCIVMVNVHLKLCILLILISSF